MSRETRVNRTVRRAIERQLEKTEAKKPVRGYRIARVLAFVIGIPGVLAALLSLLPRVSVSLSDPVDPQQPFSSSVTVTNTGFIKIFAVTPYWAPHEVWGAARLPTSNRVGTPYLSRGHFESWGIHDLGPDEHFSFPLNEAITVPVEVLGGADIAIIVTYETPLLHLPMEKVFPYVAKRQTNGKFYWYSDSNRN
jgi:hypothetical protein